jgi:hypothetical protein
VGLKELHSKNKQVTVYKSLVLGRILSINDLRDTIWISDLGRGMLEVCIGQIH